MKKKHVIILILSLLMVAAVWIYLSIIAPNVERFEKHSKRLELKKTMVMVYTALMRGSAETTYFTTDLEFLKAYPENDLLVKYGFTIPSDGSQFAEKFNTGLKDTDVLDSEGIAIYDDEISIYDIPFDEIAQEYCPDCTATRRSFKFIAFTNLDDDSSLDVWTLDHQKNFVNIEDDLKN